MKLTPALVDLALWSVLAFVAVALFWPLIVAVLRG